MAVRKLKNVKHSAPAKAERDLTLIKGQSDMELDNLIHEKKRLAIVSALAVNRKLTFNDLKSLLKLSDGNLSAHARKLEDAEYINCSKGFDGRVPRTDYQLTAKGRKALKNYLSHMEALITAVRKA